MPKSSNSSGKRNLKVRVKTAKKRSVSSARWLQRQLNDPYVQRAKREGYRSRAAYKLIELDDKFQFLKPGKIVLDLGAAPGGWTQVAVSRVREPGAVIAVDILPMDAIAGALVLKLDFLDAAAPQKIKDALAPTLSRYSRSAGQERGKEDGVDIVLSDMAPNTTGHAATDHLRIMALLEAAYPFACEVLRPGGVFIAKVFQGGTEKELLALMKKDFASVKHAKPKASRADSAEVYVVATGFKPLRRHEER